MLVAVYTYDTLENFENLMPSEENSNYLLSDSYPINGKLTNNTTELWKSYPITKLPSLSQRTNNMPSYTNPDNGNCSQLELCNAFYGNKQQDSSNTTQISNNDQCSGVRVGIFCQKK